MGRVLTWLETEVPPWVEPPLRNPGPCCGRFEVIAFMFVRMVSEYVVVWALSLVITLLGAAVPGRTIDEVVKSTCDMPIEEVAEVDSEMTPGNYTPWQTEIISYTWSYKYHAGTTSLGIESVKGRLVNRFIWPHGWKRTIWQQPGDVNFVWRLKDKEGNLLATLSDNVDIYWPDDDSICWYERHYIKAVSADGETSYWWFDSY